MSTKNSEALIFDLDGTIIDSRYGILNSFNHALHQVGEKDVEEKTLLKLVGRISLEEQFRILLPKDKHSLIAQCVKIFREHYNENSDQYTKLYPNVIDVLQYLKNTKKKLAIATTRHTTYAIRSLEYFGIKELFETVIGGDKVVNKKPHPEIIFKVVKLLNANKEKTYVIGDTVVDIITGKNAGVKTIAVTYGLDTKEELQRGCPDYIINSITQLRNLF